MPVIQIKTNVLLNDESKNRMLSAISNTTSIIMNKPQSDIMVMYSHNDIYMGGIYDAAMFIDFRCISGLNFKVAKQLSEAFLEKAKEEIETLNPSRVYLSFYEAGDIYSWRFMDGTAVCPGSSKYCSQANL